ncbi:hypothetical protein BB559_003242 [Furculomyces boomerangus]|uniref:Peptidase S1 domain-containing protein n=1 Tax=Furculomyces boomerangus TaxID=61424 RepID=A0A2T9YMC5_9FUNG|nr:hypothetical protein BB559_003242 [Furculomyces boomerangus]
MKKLQRILLSSLCIPVFVHSYKFEPINSYFEKTIEDNKRVSISSLADPNAFPFIASLLILDNDEFKACSAAIIDKSWLLTPASCVNSKGSTLKPNNLRVGVANSNRGKQKYLKVQQIIVDPDYNNKSLYPDHNVALVQLSEALEFGNNTKRISIDNDDTKEFSSVIVAGWESTGSEKNSRASFDLSYKMTNLKSGDFCSQNSKEYTKMKYRTVCTGIEDDGSNSCYGDAGALMFSKAESGEYRLVGMASYGNNPRNSDKPICNLNEGAAYYTNLRSYLDFLEDKTGIKRKDLTRNEDSVDQLSGNKVNSNENLFQSLDNKAELVRGNSVYSSSNNPVVYVTVSTDKTVTVDTTSSVLVTVQSCSPTSLSTSSPTSSPTSSLPVLTSTSTRTFSVTSTSTNTVTVSIPGSTVTSSLITSSTTLVSQTLSGTTDLGTSIRSLSLESSNNVIKITSTRFNTVTQVVGKQTDSIRALNSEINEIKNSIVLIMNSLQPTSTATTTNDIDRFTNIVVINNQKDDSGTARTPGLASKTSLNSFEDIKPLLISRLLNPDTKVQIPQQAVGATVSMDRIDQIIAELRQAINTENKSIPKANLELIQLLQSL